MILLNACCPAIGECHNADCAKKMNMMRATGQSTMFGGALLAIGMMIGTNSLGV